MKRLVYPSSTAMKLLNGFRAVRPGATREYQQRLNQVTPAVAENIQREAVRLLSTIQAAGATNDSFVREASAAAMVLAITAHAEFGAGARARLERPVSDDH